MTKLSIVIICAMLTSCAGTPGYYETKTIYIEEVSVQQVSGRIVIDD